jgi:type IX secretion system PorP/SprF family membrane protein
MSDQIGLFTHQRLSGQFAHKKKMFGGTLSIGVQAGLLTEKLDGSELDLDQTGDLAFNTSEVNGQVIDFGAGLYYTRGRWYVGLSGQHLTSPTIELGETNELKVDATFYLTSGYNIKLRNPFFTIHPSVLAHTDGTTYRVNVTTRVKYTHDKKMLYAGLAYSPNNSVTALIGGNFHGITLGYSYEVYTSVLKIGNGSHELFVGYQTELNFEKKGRNRHQSVRIL